MDRRCLGEESLIVDQAIIVKILIIKNMIVLKDFLKSACLIEGVKSYLDNARSNMSLLYVLLPQSRITRSSKMNKAP